MLCLSGVGLSFIWAENPFAARIFLPTSAGLASLFALLFTRAFLNIKSFAPLIDPLVKVVSVLAVTMIIASWLNPEYGAQLSSWLGGLVIILLLTTGLFGLVNGVIIARYFVFAWTAFIVGTLLYVLSLFDVVAVTGVTNHSIQVGSALEVLLLSFALAHRIKVERTLKIQAIRKQYKAEQQMKHLELQTLKEAMHDSITKMPNESLLKNRLEEIMSGHILQRFALVSLHYPQIKEIASTMGRVLAERMLSLQVDRINQALLQCPESILIEEKPPACLAVAELGSIAFLMDIHKIDAPIRLHVETLINEQDNIIETENMCITLNWLCGIAVFPEHGERPEQLLQHAYAARDCNVSRNEYVQLYNHEISEYSHRRLALMGALALALNRRELQVYLQPQLRSDDLELVGAEVLVRWPSRTFGNVPTTEFIDIAEQIGLMDQLSKYVVLEAFRVMTKLHNNGLAISLSINLSVQNLASDKFINFIIEQAERHKLPFEYLIFEVTETSMMQNIQSVVSNLKKLTQVGCRIALDDFGTGYSSLAYLSRLPFHELKIDQSFITHILSNSNDLRIVENTLKLAQALNLETVAEGIEDVATLQAIIQLGCERVQGYYCGKPMSANEFCEWSLDLVAEKQI